MVVVVDSCPPPFHDRVFDAHTSLQRAHFDYRYMSFDSDFLELLTLKEEAGLVFWFRVSSLLLVSVRKETTRVSGHV